MTGAQEQEDLETVSTKQEDLETVSAQLTQNIKTQVRAELSGQLDEILEEQIPKIKTSLVEELSHMQST